MVSLGLWLLHLRPDGRYVLYTKYPFLIKDDAVFYTDSPFLIKPNSSAVNL
jgi:hypothetical protein